MPADSDLACGIGGKDGTPLIADAPAGSQVSFQWEYVSTCSIPVGSSKDCTIYSGRQVQYTHLVCVFERISGISNQITKDQFQLTWLPAMATVQHSPLILQGGLSWMRMAIQMDSGVRIG